MDLFTLEIATRCHICGRPLELVEDGEHLWMGCRGCLRYVKKEKRDLVRKYFNYRERKIEWRKMVLELYQLYLS